MSKNVLNFDQLAFDAIVVNEAVKDTIVSAVHSAAKEVGPKYFAEALTLLEDKEQQRAA